MDELFTKFKKRWGNSNIKQTFSYTYVGFPNRIGETSKENGKTWDNLLTAVNKIWRKFPSSRLEFT